VSVDEKNDAVYGSHGENRMFLEILRKKARQKTKSVSFDPLDGLCDGISIGIKQYLATHLKENAVDASSFLKLEESEDEVIALEDSRERLLALAVTHLKSASEFHFALEGIYSASVDFSKNNLVCEKIISEIF
jgi:hypothetical protein